MQDQSYNTVSEMSQVPPDGHAAIAVIIRHGSVLFGLREYSPKKGGARVWTAPGGSVESGEDLAQAVRRETQEETGVNDLHFIDYIGKVEAPERDPLHVFHCETNSAPELTEPDKFHKWKWFKLRAFADGEPENYINESARKIIVDYLRENDML